MFACTDKNLSTPPTSKATFALSGWRIVEAVVVCTVFVPIFQFKDGEDVDSDDDGKIDRVSAFQLKSFIAVYLSVCSFACLLAAAAAEKVGEATNKKLAAVNVVKSWKMIGEKVKLMAKIKKAQVGLHHVRSQAQIICRAFFRLCALVFYSSKATVCGVPCTVPVLYPTIQRKVLHHATSHSFACMASTDR